MGKVKLAALSLVVCGTIAGVGFASWVFAPPSVAVTGEVAVDGVNGGNYLISTACEAPVYTAQGFPEEGAYAFSAELTVTFSMDVGACEADFGEDFLVGIALGYSAPQEADLFAEEKYLSAEGGAFVDGEYQICAAGEGEIRVVYRFDFGDLETYRTYFYGPMRAGASFVAAAFPQPNGGSL